MADIEKESPSVTGYLPYFDCPCCGRHRLECELGLDGDATFVRRITCEKCGWDSDVADAPEA